MPRLLEPFEERLAEVEAYISFLTVMETQARSGPPKLEGAEHPISTQQQKILYASVYLQLYNLVESTITKCIESVAAAAQEQMRWQPGDLTLPLRREWVRASARTHIDLTPDHRLNSALSMCDQLVAAAPVADFSVEKGGGGNWDDYAIEAISLRLGFTLQVSSAAYSGIKRPIRNDLGALGVVKDFRNRLAHGSISFTECAENETVAGLTDLKERTVNYLREVVQRFDSYIDQFEFIVPERRPA